MLEEQSILDIIMCGGVEDDPYHGVEDDPYHGVEDDPYHGS